MKWTKVLFLSLLVLPSCGTTGQVFLQGLANQARDNAVEQIDGVADAVVTPIVTAFIGDFVENVINEFLLGASVNENNLPSAKFIDQAVNLNGGPQERLLRISLSRALSNVASFELIIDGTATISMGGGFPAAVIQVAGLSVDNPSGFGAFIQNSSGDLMGRAALRITFSNSGKVIELPVSGELVVLI